MGTIKIIGGKVARSTAGNIVTGDCGCVCEDCGEDPTPPEVQLQVTGHYDPGCFRHRGSSGEPYYRYKWITPPVWAELSAVRTLVRSDIFNQGGSCCSWLQYFDITPAVMGEWYDSNTTCDGTPFETVQYTRIKMQVNGFGNGNTYQTFTGQAAWFPWMIYEHDAAPPPAYLCRNRSGLSQQYSSTCGTGLTSDVWFEEEGI